ncbi:MAG: hypothetical protein AB7W47_15680 [Calditrichaceae bacterium]
MINSSYSSKLSGIKQKYGIPDNSDKSLTGLMTAEHDLQIELISRFCDENENIQLSAGDLYSISRLLRNGVFYNRPKFKNIARIINNSPNFVPNLFLIDKNKFDFTPTVQDVVWLALQLNNPKNQHGINEVPNDGKGEETHRLIESVYNHVDKHEYPWLFNIRYIHDDPIKRAKKIVSESFRSEASLNEILNTWGIYIEWRKLFQNNGEELINALWGDFKTYAVNAYLPQNEKYIKYVLRLLFEDGKKSEKTFTERFELLLSVFDKNEILHKPFLEICEKLFGNPPDWSAWAFLSDQLKHKYNELRGFVKYKYFEIISRLLYKKLRSEPEAISASKNHKFIHNLTLLNSRTVFWSNYRKSILNVNIFIPNEYYHYVKSQATETGDVKYHLSDEFFESIAPTSFDVPIAILYFKNCVVVEYFQGSGNDSLIISDEKIIATPQKIKNMFENHPEALKLIAGFCVRHNPTWMKSLKDHLSLNFNIECDEKDIFNIPAFDKTIETFGSRAKRSIKEITKYYEKMRQEGHEIAVSATGNEQKSVVASVVKPEERTKKSATKTTKPVETKRKAKKVAAKKNEAVGSCKIDPKDKSKNRSNKINKYAFGNSTIYQCNKCLKCWMNDHQKICPFCGHSETRIKNA